MKEEDIDLNGEQKEEAIKRLKSTPFERLEIDKHYNNPYGPRHGVPLEKAKEIYIQFTKIINVSYRNSDFGRKYCFIYRINKKHSYKLLFFLDREPPIIFNAIQTGSHIEDKLLRKFFGKFKQ